MLEEKRGDGQLTIRQFVEDVLSVVCSIVLPHTSVIPPHDEVGAPVILSSDGVEDRFSRASVSHCGRVDAQYYPIGRVVVPKQALVRLDSHICRDIVRLCLAHQRMQQQPIADLEGSFLDILVCAMDRVARLEGNNAAPSPLSEHTTGLGGVMPEFWKLDHPRSVHQLDVAPKKNVALRVYTCNTWMLVVLGPVDLLAFPLLVVGELLFHVHDAHDMIGRIHQRYVLSLLQKASTFLGHGERNRYGPKGAVGEVHMLDHGLVVFSTKEAGQWAIGSDGHQLEVRDAYRVQPNMG